MGDALTQSEPVWETLINTGIYNDLEGVIDIHCHPNPDFCARLLDDVDLVAIAKAVKMRAVMIKSHYSATHERAYAAQKSVGGGIDVFGLICLNPTVGGFNPLAVSIALQNGARGVWMPSMWSEHHAHYARVQGASAGYKSIGMNFPEAGKGLTILNANGTVKDTVREILDLVAAADVMLATGHLSVDESHMLLREAKARGITKTVVHTANYHVLKFPSADLKQMVDDYGAVVEMGFSSLPNGVWDPRDPGRNISVQDVGDTIRWVGAENVVLSTDCGQFSVAMPIEAMRLWFVHMRSQGFTEDEIHKMTRTTPARLLGIENAFNSKTKEPT